MARRAKCANCYVCDKQNCPMEQSSQPPAHKLQPTSPAASPEPSPADNQLGRAKPRDQQ